MRYLKFTVILLIGCFLGCSAVHNSNEYQDSPPHTQKLSIPSSLNTATLDDYYPIPKIHPQSKPSVISLEPPRVD